MKALLISALSVFLVACSPPIEDVNDSSNIKFNVLRATQDAEKISDVSVFCIDGVKYVVIPGIGMAPKYIKKSYIGNIMYSIEIETCINQ